MKRFLNFGSEFLILRLSHQLLIKVNMNQSYINIYYSLVKSVRQSLWPCILRGFLLLEHRDDGFEFHSEHECISTINPLCCSRVHGSLEMGQFLIQEIIQYLCKNPSTANQKEVNRCCLQNHMDSHY